MSADNATMLARCRSLAVAAMLDLADDEALARADRRGLSDRESRRLAELPDRLVDGLAVLLRHLK